MEGDGDTYQFSLARSLGMTVGELNARMGTDEYAMWLAYDQWLAAKMELAKGK